MAAAMVVVIMLLHLHCVIGSNIGKKQSQPTTRGAFTKNDVELVKTKLVLSKIASRYHPLVPVGDNQYVSQCSFHADDNPSMQINDDVAG